MRSVATSLCSN